MTKEPEMSPERRAVLEFYRASWKKHGRSPSRKEALLRFGTTSQALYLHLGALVRLGLLVHTPSSYRPAKEKKS